MALQILYPILCLAVIGAGGCVTGANPGYTVGEIVHHLSLSRAKFVITQETCAGRGRVAAHQCGIPSNRTFIFDHGPLTTSDYPSLDDLLCHGESTWEQWEVSKEGTKNLTSTQFAMISSTSGTTGLPKAAAIPHQYLIAQAVMIEKHNGGQNKHVSMSGHQVSWQLILLQVSQLVALPVFHAFAMQLVLIMPLRQGTPTYFLPRFDMQLFTDKVFEYSITDVAVVPPIISSLLRLPRSKHYQLGSLRYIVCAGATMNANLQSKLYDILSPEAVVAQCWGMTEVGWITSFARYEKDVSGSVGRLLPGVELQ